jgi:hypothetical protein
VWGGDTVRAYMRSPSWREVTKISDPVVYVRETQKVGKSARPLDAGRTPRLSVAAGASARTVKAWAIKEGYSLFNTWFLKCRPPSPAAGTGILVIHGPTYASVKETADELPDHSVYPPQVLRMST